MPVVTATYERKTFRVEAVRITSTNMEEVAEWCGGRVVKVQDYGWGVYDQGRSYVQVPTGHQHDKIAHAHIGNWVTCLTKTNSFRVYKEKSFLMAFRGILSETEKYAKVHELLVKVTRAQDAATFHGDSGSGEVALLIEQAAREICSMA